MEEMDSEADNNVRTLTFKPKRIALIKGPKNSMKNLFVVSLLALLLSSCGYLPESIAVGDTIDFNEDISILYSSEILVHTDSLDNLTYISNEHYDAGLSILDYSWQIPEGYSVVDEYVTFRPSVVRWTCGGDMLFADGVIITVSGELRLNEVVSSSQTTLYISLPGVVAISRNIDALPYIAGVGFENNCLGLTTGEIEIIDISR